MGISFFLQVAVEAEGSGPVGGLDEGSGSGDIVGNEDLLRVSIKGLKDWCWAPGREGHGLDSSDCRIGPMGTVSSCVWQSSYTPLYFIHV